MVPEGGRNPVNDAMPIEDDTEEDEDVASLSSDSTETLFLYRKLLAESFETTLTALGKKRQKRISERAKFDLEYGAGSYDAMKEDVELRNSLGYDFDKNSYIEIGKNWLGVERNAAAEKTKNGTPTALPTWVNFIAYYDSSTEESKKLRDDVKGAGKKRKEKEQAELRRSKDIGALYGQANAVEFNKDKQDRLVVQQRSQRFWDKYETHGRKWMDDKANQMGVNPEDPESFHPNVKWSEYKNVFDLAERDLGSDTPPPNIEQTAADAIAVYRAIVRSAKAELRRLYVEASDTDDEKKRQEAANKVIKDFVKSIVDAVLANPSDAAWEGPLSILLASFGSDYNLELTDNVEEEWRMNTIDIANYAPGISKYTKTKQARITSARNAAKNSAASKLKGYLGKRGGDASEIKRSFSCDDDAANMIMHKKNVLFFQDIFDTTYMEDDPDPSFENMGILPPNHDVFTVDEQKPYSLETIRALFIRAERIPAVAAEIEAPPGPPPLATNQHFGNALFSEYATGETCAVAPERNRVADTATQNVINSYPMVFHKPAAKAMLKQHLESIADKHQKAVDKNASARYVNVHTALGPIDAAVSQLLPTFESMLRYWATSLVVKQFEIQRQLSLAQVSSESSESKLNKQLKGVFCKQGFVNGISETYASELNDWWSRFVFMANMTIAGQMGQLPGQLYTPQPMFLPLRIAAPPRVGKSATALLVASIARRCGMTMLYSVAPNKTLPIGDMTTKMKRLDWVKQETERVSIDFPFYTIDDKAIFDGSYRYDENTNDPPNPNLVFYSSDQLRDCQRVGALLASWRYSSLVVFHMRDEAQTLAKGLSNPSRPSHKTDIPTPATISYLRYFFGNVFGLNMLITATHYPTLTEQDLWGYIGSVGQNIRISALPAKAISSYVSNDMLRKLAGYGSLPFLVPALQPPFNADANAKNYVGVDQLQTWTFGETPIFVSGGFLPAENTTENEKEELYKRDFLLSKKAIADMTARVQGTPYAIGMTCPDVLFADGAAPTERQLTEEEKKQDRLQRQLDELVEEQEFNPANAMSQEANSTLPFEEATKLQKWRELTEAIKVQTDVLKMITSTLTKSKNYGVSDVEPSKTRKQSKGAAQCDVAAYNLHFADWITQPPLQTPKYNINQMYLGAILQNVTEGASMFAWCNQLFFNWSYRSGNDTVFLIYQTSVRSPSKLDSLLSNWKVEPYDKQSENDPFHFSNAASASDDSEDRFKNVTAVIVPGMNTPLRNNFERAKPVVCSYARELPVQPMQSPIQTTVGDSSVTSEDGKRRKSARTRKKTVTEQQTEARNEEAQKKALALDETRKAVAPLLSFLTNYIQSANDKTLTSALLGEEGRSKFNTLYSKYMGSARTGNYSVSFFRLLDFTMEKWARFATDDFVKAVISHYLPSSCPNDTNFDTITSSRLVSLMKLKSAITCEHVVAEAAASVPTAAGASSSSTSQTASGKPIVYVKAYNSTQSAITEIFSCTGIQKYAVVGYSMLRAGTTIQTIVPHDIKNASGEDAKIFSEINNLQAVIKAYESTADLEDTLFNEEQQLLIMAAAQDAARELQPWTEENFKGVFDSEDGVGRSPDYNAWLSKQLVDTEGNTGGTRSLQSLASFETAKRRIPSSVTGLNVVDVMWAVYDNYNLIIVKREAKLRIQLLRSQIKGKSSMFCATYMALNPNSTSSLDASLQLVGRTFADLRDESMPEGYAIKLLGGHMVQQTLASYSDMEKTLVDARLTDNDGNIKPLTVFDVLRQAIGPGVVTGKTGDVDIGTVGVRRVNFLEIFGFTLSEVKRLRTLARNRNEMSWKSLLEQEEKDGVGGGASGGTDASGPSAMQASP